MISTLFQSIADASRLKASSALGRRAFTFSPDRDHFEGAMASSDAQVCSTYGDSNADITSSEVFASVSSRQTSRQASRRADKHRQRWQPPSPAPSVEHFPRQHLPDRNRRQRWDVKTNGRQWRQARHRRAAVRRAPEARSTTRSATPRRRSRARRCFNHACGGVKRNLVLRLLPESAVNATGARSCRIDHREIGDPAPIGWRIGLIGGRMSTRYPAPGI